MDLNRILFWAGDDSSFHLYLDALKYARLHPTAALDSANMFAHDDETEYDRPALNVVGNTAIVPVHGSLVKRSNFFTSLFGLTGYDEIRDQMVMAAQADEVKNILLDIDTTGGSASGVSELSTLIKRIDRNIKPVYAHTGGEALSAGYFIASSARQVTVSEMGQVGSIGVVAMHADMSKMLEEEGVKVTVFRVGEFKAPLSPYEPLTEKAEGIVLAEMQEMYNVFVRSVADGRHESESYIRQSAAEGRVFIGRQGVEVRLADGVKSIDDVIGQLNSTTAGSGQRTRQAQGYAVSAQLTELESGLKEEPSMDEITLTPEAAAALAEGASPEAVAELNQSVLDALAADEGTDEGADPHGEDDVLAIPGSDTATDNGNVIEPELEAAPGAALQSANEFSYFADKIAELSAEVADLKASNKQLAQVADDFQTVESGFRQVTMERINSMSIALGGSALPLDATPSAALLEQHQQLRAKFCEKFPVGGVYQGPSTDKPEPVAADNVTPLSQGGRRASRIR